MRRILAPTVIALAAGSGLAAQNGTRPAPVPFGVGERGEYAVTLGIFGEVGKGSMEVVKVDEVHGHAAYHLRFELEGRVTFAKVDDTLESWLDVDQLFARRFHKDQHEVNYKTNRWYDFFPDSMIYRRENGDVDSLATAEPLDEVSFLYWVRTIPELEVGKTYTYHRYYKESGNPVRLKVLRREMIRGENDTEVPVVVVQPIIRTGGLFGEGGEAEVYFTDDWRRILVKMTSKVPIIGRLGLRLINYEAGRRLAELDG